MNNQAKQTNPQPTVELDLGVRHDVTASIAHRSKDSEFADDELINWWASEAAQAHRFRNWAFSVGVIASLILLGVWLWIMLFCWPDSGYTTALIMAYGVKLSLCTLTFLSVVIATLRFAIRCYGHHQDTFSNTNEVGQSNFVALGKVLETLGKTLSQQ